MYSNTICFLQGKALIKPIAFRPTPGPNSGASTPTNGPTFMHGGPFMRPGSSNGPESLHGLTRASPAGPVPAVFGTTPTNEGFAPGHPLVKDGRRHYGSKSNFLCMIYEGRLEFFLVTK